jgi:2-polyprenyl-6-methoxyphenol hydroxylase-like FAD-dependent oxidoreductase
MIPAGPDVSRADVLIVGAGPVGTALALHAQRHGADVCLVERRTHLGAVVPVHAAVAAHAGNPGPPRRGRGADIAPGGAAASARWITGWEWSAVSPGTPA